MSADSSPVPKTRCAFIKPTSVYISPIHNVTPKLHFSASQAIQDSAPHLSVASRNSC